MKVLFDTSVLVAALLELHPNHKLAFPWLLNVKKGKHLGFISMHSLAELYAILTTIPIHRKVATNEIWTLISNSILQYFQIVELTKSDYQQILQLLSTNELRGGIIYDSLIAHAAYKAKVDKLLTFNTKHFKKAYPLIADIVEEPN
jgi:predicted nucleic acid-binding protein